MADAHPFTPSDDDPRVCAHVVVKRTTDRWGGQTCGLPRSNARVHAPGAIPPASPEPPVRHLSAVPSIGEPTVFVRGHAGETEVQAATTAKRTRGELRRSVLHALYHPSHRKSGRTFDEIKSDLRKPDRHSSITSAVRGLVLGGLVQALMDDEGSRVTRLSGSGVPSTAWVLTPAGDAACAADTQEAFA